MKIRIIFPEKYFDKLQLDKLAKYDLKFIEGKDVDLDDIDELYSGDDIILASDPTYLKDSWNAYPIKRIKRMKGLKALCLTTTSYSWVDVNKVRDLGIIVTNTPGKSTEAVAEFNIFMMYSLLRKLPLIVKNEWKMNYDDFINEEARGLVAGIIGLGNIGTRVAELCRGNGMDVIYWNRSKKDVSYKAVGLSELIKESDVIFSTIATPPELKGFITKKTLKNLKDNAIIVSTSDTHVFDSDFILQQVALGKVGGYAFESHEKKLGDYKGNVIIFPEQAYFTTGTLKNTARILTETILSVLSGKPINVVN